MPSRFFLGGRLLAAALIVCVLAGAVQAAAQEPEATPAAAPDVVADPGVLNAPPTPAADFFDTIVGGGFSFTAADLLFNDTDPDGDALVFLGITGGPDSGFITENGGVFTYTHDQTIPGTDFFLYAVGDGNGNEATAAVNISIDQVNRPPAATGDFFTTIQDTPVSFTVADLLANDADPDGDPVNFGGLGGPPANGEVTDAGGVITFTPNSGFVGIQNLFYFVNDGLGGSSGARITITVVPANRAPVAVGEVASTPRGTPISIPAPGVLGNDVDPDGDTLTVDTVSHTEQHGVAVINRDGSLSYTPDDPGFVGTDTTSYTVTDGSLSSGAVTITWIVFNLPPVAADNALTTAEDTPLLIPAGDILFNDSDPNGDTLTVAAITQQPQHGALTANGDGTFTYTPFANVNGTDSFGYQATDGVDVSNVATVNLTITPVNDAPVAVADEFTTTAGKILDIAAPGLLGNDTDIDGDTLTAAVLTGPSHGQLEIRADGSFTYKPALLFTGTDTFTYTVRDGNGGSDIGSATVTVAPANIPPVGLADAYTATSGRALRVNAPGVLFNDTDLNGDPLTAQVSVAPAHGSLTLNPDGSFVYTSTTFFVGIDTFRYVVADGAGPAGGTASILVTIVVLPRIL